MRLKSVRFAVVFFTVAALSTAAKGNKAIHNAVAPNDAAMKKDGKYIHEPVWRYMLIHPVDKVGQATPLDPDCQKKWK